MTAAEFDRLTTWSPERWAPFDWDGRTPYLLRDGVMDVRGFAVRAYLFSDRTRLVNVADLEAARWWERRNRSSFPVRDPSRMASVPSVPFSRRRSMVVVASRAGPARILCVDDSRDAADSLAALLTAMGYDARACYDGPTALRVAAEFEPDACLIDLNMPGMDGDELALRLRADAGDAPMILVAITGRNDAEARLRIEAAGFHQHLVKPAAVEQIVNAMSKPGT
ncbi:response regulator [Limnoglobus roseus]|uniref:Response regulator n=1 Tax=Limnoglobus roseus TaxID=2598579 RepID=A0A5C1ACW3_9BACT|nr:response regulator [Limnoglobus roseus]QEL15612.1 response regulator [Limnoglobus roseus]